MNLSFFEGPAGSGKTTRLFETLATTLAARPLLPHERVLALTKMHGSRRRMHGRLSSVAGLRDRFNCMTVDSFAWRLVRRWRTLAGAKGWSEPPENDYAEVSRCAGLLLADGIVNRWVARGFPIVVIDEMQDSKGGQLEIVRGLSQSAICLIAADDFQDLDGGVDNAAIAWARESGKVVRLSQNHRTTAAGLLNAAQSLRGGQAVPIKGQGFTILGALNANVGAGFVSRNLTWWSGTRDIAVISPVRPDVSPFVRDLLLRVAQKPIGTPPFGPHRVPWEVSQEDECQFFLTGLGLPSDDAAELCAADLVLTANNAASKVLRMWLDQQRTLSGRTRFAAREIQERARAIHQRSRAYRRAPDGGVRAMTIHQAKNREFESVIILWPYQVVGSADRKRRLLYNAITRAKRQAMVVIQNPARLNEPPFVAGDS
ncbi:MAG: ATP-dependent helicase [Acidobacteriota bacterium]